MLSDPPRRDHPPTTPRASRAQAVAPPRPNPLGLVLSTRTAAEAAHGLLAERLLALRVHEGEGAAPGIDDELPDPGPFPRGEGFLPRPRPADPRLAERGTRPARTAARDQVHRAVQAYVRALVREGVAAPAALQSARLAVRDGAAFLGAAELDALETDIVQGARTVR